MAPIRELYEELPSTQDRAIALARSGAPDGSRVVARRQLRGRGRDDRLWASPRGGLYLSLVLRDGPATPWLPLAVGAELAFALEQEYGIRVRLKWPNDLLVVDGSGTGRKLSGILLDRVADGDRGPAAVAGIGVNVRAPADGFPPALRGSVATLEEFVDRPIDLEALEARVAEAAASAARWLGTPGGANVAAGRCRGRLYGVGEELRVDGAPAGEVVGLRDDGGLELRGPDGSRVLHSGYVQIGRGGVTA